MQLQQRGAAEKKVEQLNLLSVIVVRICFFLQIIHTSLKKLISWCVITACAPLHNSLKLKDKSEL